MKTELAEISIPSGEPTSLSLTIPQDQTFEEWQALGRRLCAAFKIVNWYIGDWWIAGHHRYGERASAVTKGIFGRNMQTVMNFGSIARAFETSRRREVLSFTHHAEVIGLPPAEADALLDIAEAKGLPAAKLRVYVRVRKIELGLFQQADINDKDAAAEAMTKIQHIWNYASFANRRYVFESIEEAVENGFSDIDHDWKVISI